MSSTMKMERLDDGPDQYDCDCCGKVWTFEQLDNISDISERIDPGGTVPAGQCPDGECGALCYPVTLEMSHDPDYRPGVINLDEEEAARMPAVSPDPNANWKNDAIQFPRLICEIADVVLRPEDYAEIAASMDVTKEELEELFDRALAAWDGIKARTPAK